MAKGHVLQKTGAYCNGYNTVKDTYSLRTVEACEAHIRTELPDAKFFFFNQQGNWACAGCPSSFTGEES